MRSSEPSSRPSGARGRRPRRTVPLLGAFLLAVAAAAGTSRATPPASGATPTDGPARTASSQQAERYELSGPDVHIADLVGHVTITSGQGDKVVVLVRRGGRDADKLDVHADAGAGTLLVRTPGDRVVYPELGRRSHTTVRMDDRGLFDGGRRIEISGHGDGIEAWADLTIQVPRGLRAEVELGAGRMDARDVPGELALHTGSGEVHASGTGGALIVHSGSGDVRADSTAGRLEVHTGSGDIAVREASADAELETGSGGIDVQGRVGGDLRARTGSGSVSAGAVGGQSVDVRTGSGGIRLGPLAAGRVVLHSGSGSVTARLERSPSSLRVDTGSGGVDLELPGDASADLDIETGSGGVRVDFPFQLVSSGRNHVRGTLGGGGPEYTIRTGSGEVHLSKAAGGSGG